MRAKSKVHWPFLPGPARHRKGLVIPISVLSFVPDEMKNT